MNDDGCQCNNEYNDNCTNTKKFVSTVKTKKCVKFEEKKDSVIKKIVMVV